MTTEKEAPPEGEGATNEEQRVAVEILVRACGADAMFKLDFPTVAPRLALVSRLRAFRERDGGR